MSSSALAHRYFSCSEWKSLRCALPGKLSCNALQPLQQAASSWSTGQKFYGHRVLFQIDVLRMLTYLESDSFSDEKYWRFSWKSEFFSFPWHLIFPLVHRALQPAIAVTGSHFSFTLSTDSVTLNPDNSLVCDGNSVVLEGTSV